MIVDYCLILTSLAYCIAIIMPSVCLSVVLCFVAKRYILQQKSLNKWIGSALLGTQLSTPLLLLLLLLFCYREAWPWLKSAGKVGTASDGKDPWKNWWLWITSSPVSSVTALCDNSLVVEEKYYR